MQKLYFSKKTLGKKCINYLGPKYYNYIPFTIHIYQYPSNNCKQNDDKKIIAEW